MTIEDIYGQIASHMIKGLMVHDQLANYYDFLGLKGYSQCHQYHYLQQSCCYRKLCKYYTCYYNKLIPEVPVENPKEIPFSWFKYSRMDVDINTKRNAVKVGLENWMTWEKQTLSLYQELFKELYNLNQIASAYQLEKIICNVQEQIKEVEQYYLQKKAVDFDMDNIISEQKNKKEKYKKKKRELCQI